MNVLNGTSDENGYAEAEFRDFPLRDFFIKLIAKRDKVSVEKITPTWILRQREKEIYPNTKFDISSKRGGYSSDGLISLTRTDIDIIISVAEHGNTKRNYWLSHLQ